MPTQTTNNPQVNSNTAKPASQQPRKENMDKGSNMQNDKSSEKSGGGCGC